MSRYTSEIIKKKLNLDLYGIENLYKSIRTSTRFRFESDYLENQRGEHSIMLTAKYFDYYDGIKEKIYRYYILTNEKRREMVKIMNQIDHKLGDIKDEECIKHNEQKGYRLIRGFSDIPVIGLKELEKLETVGRGSIFVNLEDTACNGPNQNHTHYYMDGNNCEILGEKKASDERYFMVLVEKKEVVLSDLKGLIKSIKFKDRELIGWIPLEKRAEKRLKDEKSYIYDSINRMFQNDSVWEMVIDMNTLTSDEIMAYLGINAHSLLTVQNLNVIEERCGRSNFIIVNT